MSRASGVIALESNNTAPRGAEEKKEKKEKRRKVFDLRDFLRFLSFCFSFFFRFLFVLKNIFLRRANRITEARRNKPKK